MLTELMIFAVVLVALQMVSAVLVTVVLWKLMTSKKYVKKLVKVSQEIAEEIMEEMEV